MVVWKNLIGFYVILVLTIVAMFISLWWVDPSNPRDSILSVIGGVFGGIAFVYYMRAYPDLFPKG